MNEPNLIEMARKAHADLTAQLRALQRVTADQDSRAGERYWASKTALRSADTLQAALDRLNDGYRRAA